MNIKLKNYYLTIPVLSNSQLCIISKRTNKSICGCYNIVVPNESRCYKIPLGLKYIPIYHCKECFEKAEING